MRVRLTVDVAPELKRRVRMAAAARDLSVKEFVEAALRRELETRPIEESSLDRAWLESDLSELAGIEPYEWGDGELEEGELVESGTERA